MSKEKSAPKAAAGKPPVPNEKLTFAFGKENYKLMLIGIGIVALGMILMIGGASEDPNKMSDAIFNFQRLTLAPIVIIAGYVVVLFSILKKSASKE